MDNKLWDWEETLNWDKNFHEQSEQTKQDVFEIICNESHYQAFDDYFNNYCQRIEYKLFMKYNSTIISFSSYINDKYSNGTWDKLVGELLEKAHCMQLFEQEIDGLFAMPRLNDNDIYCQKEQYFSIVKKYNDAHVRLI